MALAAALERAVAEADEMREQNESLTTQIAVDRRVRDELDTQVQMLLAQCEAQSKSPDAPRKPQHVGVLISLAAVDGAVTFASIQELQQANVELLERLALVETDESSKSKLQRDTELADALQELADLREAAEQQKVPRFEL